MCMNTPIDVTYARTYGSVYHMFKVIKAKLNRSNTL